MVDEQYRIAAFTEFTGLRKQLKNSMYILAGDFNLPAIDWNALNIKNDNQYPNTSQPDIFRYCPGYVLRTDCGFPNKRGQSA